MKLEPMVIESVEQDSNTTVINGSAVDFELNAQIVAGSLTSNAKELRQAIENELKNYSVERYINEPEKAKTDKAFLNKVKDSIAAKRKEVTKQWNKPLDDFMDEMKSLEKSITEASDAINKIVKEADEKEKSEKREKIEGYWKTLDFNIIPLEKIFNPKWLNKTCKIETVMTEIEAITEKITTELSTLRSMNDEDSETLQSFYLETLDLNATLAKGNQLKANRETIRKQNEQWKNEQLQKAAEKTVENLEKADLIPPQKQPVKKMTFVLELTGTKEQLMELRHYIDKSGITYKKVL